MVEMPSRAVSYSPDGSKIAVGFGTPIRESSKQFDGKWIVLQEDDFQVRGRLSSYDSSLTYFLAIHVGVFLSIITTPCVTMLQHTTVQASKC